MIAQNSQLPAEHIRALRAEGLPPATLHAIATSHTLWHQTLADAHGEPDDFTAADLWRAEAVKLAEEGERVAAVAPAKPATDLYDRGRRDMLNAILELNPVVAAKVAAFSDRDPDPHGRIPFDVVLWVTEVATQLGIEPRDDPAAPPPPAREPKEERLGRFGHHPDVMIDYEIEVESIENEWHNIGIGFLNGTPTRAALAERVARAMTAGPFITEQALATKDRLRAIEAEIGTPLAREPVDEIAPSPELLAEYEKLKQQVASLMKPGWYWDADDSENSCSDWPDLLDCADYEDVIEVEAGAQLPWRKWAATRCVTVDEHGAPDITERELFDTEAEARACWPDSLAAARDAGKAT